MTARFHLATITTPHGVRGAVKVKCFAEDPENVFRLPLADKNGRAFVLKPPPPLPSPASGGGRGGGLLIVTIDGVNTREAAEALRGTELFAPREALPAPKANEYYAADLVGMQVVDAAGEVLGHVASVQDFGAGPLLEVALQSGTELFPFRDAFFPQVDAEKRRITFVPPEYME